MCGIAGIWGCADEGVVRGMMKRMIHRGPDSSGVFVSPNEHSVLGHRRLSIIDPSGGHQPILGDSGYSALVANGEVYNHRVLRKECLRARGMQTQSDSEVILRLYEQSAQSSVKQLDGMFAYVIADGDHVVAARDPIGIKPLYVGKRGDDWCFASEQKAMVGLASDVEEFPPGTLFHSAHGYRRFYQLPETNACRIIGDPGEAARQVRETLEAAICKRLMSDVPLGAFLSGGLDSSIICAIARRHMDQLHTFSVGFPGSRDLAAARQVSQHLDTIHHEYHLSEGEVVRLLPKILYHLESYDQDLVRSAIPTYFTARLASQYVKVVLTGEGADELFAGYRYHQQFRTHKDLSRELRNSISALHNMNLQRVDRLTMAHSIEARVPFLDVSMIALAQQIPVRWKLRRENEQRIEKWVLRKACEDLLPSEIVWRDKEQFDEGSGTVDLVSRRALTEWLERENTAEYMQRHRRTALRSHEECVYHKVLSDAFPDGRFILDNVARWSGNQAAPPSESHRQYDLHDPT